MDFFMNEPVEAVLIGAGNRGMDVYGEFALKNPHQLRFVAVADPISSRGANFARKHSLPDDRIFNSWEDLLKEDKLASTAIITTQDRDHVDPTLNALEKGYHILLEKPMATTIDECKSLVNRAEELNRHLQICHVLRYTPFWRTLHQLLRSGRIGKIVNISLRENVSYFHYAHSFIRGNWHNRSVSTPMILAKCCHDLDILYWLMESKPVKISSFGSLTHFSSNNAPEDATDRCTDGCPAASTCLYYAPSIYLDIIPLLRVTRKGGKMIDRLFTGLILDHPKITRLLSKVIPQLRQVEHYNGWPVSVITDDLSRAGKLQALKKGPYGKCVYKIEDHDVVDHQVVNIEFANQSTATLTMHGHSHEEGRTIRIDGTRGTISGSFLLSGDYIVFNDSYSGKKEILLETGMSRSGHGGGDDGLMNAFVDLIKGRKSENSLTSGRASLESHLMAFAADKSRLESSVVNMDEIR